MNMDTISESINVLLLGDSNVGKSTLLSRLAAGPSNPNPPPYPEPITLALRHPRAHILSLSSLDTETLYDELFASYAPASEQSNSERQLRQTNVLVLCYSTASAQSLSNVTRIYRALLAKGWNTNEDVDVMLLGLKRDLRRASGWTQDSVADSEVDEELVPMKHAAADAGSTASIESDLARKSLVSVTETTVTDSEAESDINSMMTSDETSDRSVMPQEGLGAARLLRLDMYAECSAVTGELMREVWEDIAGLCTRLQKRRSGITEPQATSVRTGIGGDVRGAVDDPGWQGCCIM